MLLYIALIAIPVIAYFASQNTSGRSTAFLGLYLLILTLIVGCADMLGGYDRYIYGALFDDTALRISQGGFLDGSYLLALYPKELGYDMLNVVVGYFSLNRYVFIFIVTVIIYALVFVSLKRYASNYPLALVVFMGLWFFFTFTYLRQILAASIAWLAVDYAIRRKPVPFFAIVLLAFSFHNSAIVFAPFYFLPQRKYGTNAIIITMLLCAVVGFIGPTDALFSQFGSLSGSEQRMSGYSTEAESSGFRIDYVIEAVVFLFFILMRYDDIDEDNPQEVAMLNMALCFCAILLVFTRSLNGGRLSWFYMIGVICTLSTLGSRRSIVDAYCMSLTGLMVALFIRVLLQWGALGTLYPYKSFFTNGHRAGDWVYNIYEYDPRYDVDKFYK